MPRRVAEAVARLLELYRRDRTPGEPAPAFFRRVEPEVVRSALAEFITFDPETAKREESRDLGDSEEFRVAVITVDSGPMLKRFRPRAMGRAAKIWKRTSHITVVLRDGV